jgi:hypothetical protein
MFLAATNRDERTWGGVVGNVVISQWYKPSMALPHSLPVQTNKYLVYWTVVLGVARPSDGRAEIDRAAFPT